MVRCCSPMVLTILAIFFARVAWNMELFKDVKSLPTFQKHPKSCRDLANTAKVAPSCEDFRFLSENILLLGVGAVIPGLEMGDDGPKTDQLAVVDMTTDKIRFLELKNFPRDKVFRPHGLEYEAPNRLFVVSHAQQGEERVEIFEVSGQHSLATVELKWIGVVTPPVPKGTMNSITAVSVNEIYVTQWLPADVPRKGLLHPSGPVEILEVLYTVFYLIGHRMLGFPVFFGGRTGVYRCEVATNKCEKAFDGFVSANGITSTPDGRFVFVNDCLRQFIAVFEREANTGKLSLVLAKSLPHLGDNIHIHPLADGRMELWFGSIPDGIRFLLDLRPIPGGLMIGTFDPKNNSLEIHDGFIHDGTLLEAVATAAKWKNKVVLGGPKKTGGVLVCDVE